MLLILKPFFGCCLLNTCVVCCVVRNHILDVVLKYCVVCCGFWSRVLDTVCFEIIVSYGVCFVIVVCMLFVLKYLFVCCVF